MGYVSRVSVIDKQTTQIEVWSDAQTTWSVTNAPQDKALQNITVPDSTAIKGTIAAAYLDMFVENVQGNAAICYVSGDQYLQIRVGAAAFTNACKIPDSALYTLANAQTYQHYIFGGIDVSALFTKGDTVNVQWNDATAANANGLTLRNTQTRLRILVKF